LGGSRTARRLYDDGRTGRKTHQGCAFLERTTGTLIAAMDAGQVLALADRLLFGSSATTITSQLAPALLIASYFQIQG
jgi:hypothetical protein